MIDSRVERKARQLRNNGETISLRAYSRLLGVTTARAYDSLAESGHLGTVKSTAVSEQYRLERIDGIPRSGEKKRRIRALIKSCHLNVAEGCVGIVRNLDGSFKRVSDFGKIKKSRGFESGLSVVDGGTAVLCLCNACSAKPGTCPIPVTGRPFKFDAINLVPGYSVERIGPSVNLRWRVHKEGLANSVAVLDRGGLVLYVLRTWLPDALDVLAGDKCFGGMDGEGAWYSL